MPAPLDLQLNGYRGLDFGAADLSRERLAGICRAYRADGGGRFLATVITDALPLLERRIGALADAIERDAEIRDTVAGIHVEGPFIRAERGFVGAHPPEHACEATPEAMERLLAAGRGHVRMVTLAPERDPGFRTISMLAGRSVLVAAGHCDPSLEVLRDACAAGLSCFTHLGNGCPHLLHRHDNILHRVLACEALPFVTLNADGVHLPPFLLGAMLRWLGPERAIVVSDATAAAGMGMGTFRLGGQTVVVGEDGAAWSADRTHLVGSTATLSDLRRVLAAVGQTDAAIDRLLAINPARALAAAAGC
jgi:N-acetylglucosamine-6-phosphate deacetylase